MMWSFASKAFSGTIGSKKNKVLKRGQASSEYSDDEPSYRNSREESLECPICWESFNIVENVPYVLWCGHTLCKNCVLGLQRAFVKLPTLPIQLPFFISCPWCNLLSVRLVHKGTLKFPRKNFFLLWMVESINGDRSKSSDPVHNEHQAVSASNRNSATGNRANQMSNRRASRAHVMERSASNQGELRHTFSLFNAERLQVSLRQSLAFFVHLTAKFPLIIMFLLIVLYAIPASAAILALYILITLVFAVPSFLILYFALPSLDWLVREITTRVTVNFRPELWRGIPCACCSRSEMSNLGLLAERVLLMEQH